MVLEEQNVPEEVTSLLERRGFSAKCTISRVVEHEEAPEKLYVYRYTRNK